MNACEIVSRFIAWCPPSRVKYYCPPRGALVNSAAFDLPASIPEDAASTLRQAPATLAHRRADLAILGNLAERPL
jgi:hypothetical protein